MKTSPEKTTERMTHEMTIPSWKEAELDALVKSLNKKCKRYGIDPIVVEKSPMVIRSVFRGECLTDEIKIETIPVVITYSELKIDGGWRVLGTVERMDGTTFNIINGNVDNIGNLKEYDLTFCDHCGTHRNRRKVIVIEDSKGNRQVVGTACIKDYLGVSLQSAVFSCDLIKYLSQFWSEKNFCEDGEEFMGGFYQKPRYSLEQATRYVLRVLRRDKWTYTSCKACQYDDYKMSTAEVAKSLMYTEGRSDLKKEDLEWIAEFEHGNKDDEIIAKFIEEAKTEFPEESIANQTESFNYTFSVLLHLGYIDDQRWNLFAGMMGWRIAKYFKDLLKDKRTTKNSTYYGKVGDKVKNVELQITNTKLCESFYGNSLMVCGFFGDSEDAFVAFCSGDTDWLYEEDDEDLVSVKKSIMASFTIKGHQDRGYGKITQLTRLRKSK